MISLRKHINAYDGQKAGAFLTAWQATLSSAAYSGGQAAPLLAAGLQTNLAGLRERISPYLSPAEVAALQSEVEAEFSRWGDDAAQHSRENLNQVREMMMAVAASAAAIGDRDHRYTHRFKQLTDRLHSVAAINDMHAMRLSVLESAAEMKTCVQEMAEEGERSLAQLQQQVTQYRSELKEYQKRDLTDPLTGLANRVAIDAHIQDRIAWREKFCLAILDLNGFKQINDTLGHAAGDDLLKQFAAEIRSLLRATDLVGRWGGDEFVLVLDSPLEDATQSLSRLCEWAFGDYEIGNGSQSTHATVTAATGLAEWNGNETALDLFNRADQLMYADKKSRFGAAR